MTIERTQHQMKSDARTYCDCPRFRQGAGRSAVKPTLKAQQRRESKCDGAIQRHESRQWRARARAPQPQVISALILDQKDAIAIRTQKAEIKGQIVLLEAACISEVMRRGHENNAERHELRPPNDRWFGGCQFGITRESKAPNVRR